MFVIYSGAFWKFRPPAWNKCLYAALIA